MEHACSDCLDGISTLTATTEMMDTASAAPEQVLAPGVILPCLFCYGLFIALFITTCYYCISGFKYGTDHHRLYCNDFLVPEPYLVWSFENGTGAVSTVLRRDAK
jgi:hypothetical protein